MHLFFLVATLSINLPNFKQKKNRWRSKIILRQMNLLEGNWHLCSFKFSSRESQKFQVLSATFPLNVLDAFLCESRS